jgi:hypothetical protein
MGCIALAISILHGMLRSESSEAILTHSLNIAAVLTAAGWVFGTVADGIVRSSVEMNYRERVARLRENQNETVGP